jgi:hypothetical protein
MAGAKDFYRRRRRWRRRFLNRLRELQLENDATIAACWGRVPASANDDLWRFLVLGEIPRVGQVRTRLRSLVPLRPEDFVIARDGEAWR